MSAAALQAVDDTQTRQRILLAAERLFARFGYAGTSLRAIMAEANVNTASVHYYFGGKEALLRKLFEFRVAATNEERERLLDECERAAGKRAPSLRALLEAFFGPAIRLSRSAEGQDFNQITALCSVDPDPAVRKIVHDSYDRLARRFIALLRRACPVLEESTLYWRLHCMYGSMMYVRTQNGRVDYLLGEADGGFAAEEILDELVAFVEGGFLAPGRGRTRKKSR
jgi:AcrR family transcriptional regulator